MLIFFCWSCRLSDPTQYQSIVDAEWNIIYDKLDKCVKSGAKIVLSRLAIGELGTQYFADRDIFCAGRVMEEDLHRVATATGASVQTTVNNVIPDVSIRIFLSCSSDRKPFFSILLMKFNCIIYSSCIDACSIHYLNVTAYFLSINTLSL